MLNYYNFTKTRVYRSPSQNSAFANCETNFYSILKVDSETRMQLGLKKNHFEDSPVVLYVRINALKSYCMMLCIKLCMT